MYMSSAQFGSDYLFIHVVTSRISEQRRCSSYGNEMGECNRREKGLMSGRWPLRFIRQFSSVGSVSVVVAE